MYCEMVYVQYVQSNSRFGIVVVRYREDITKSLKKDVYFAKNRSR